MNRRGFFGLLTFLLPLCGSKRATQDISEIYWKGTMPGLVVEVSTLNMDKKALQEEMDKYYQGLKRYITLNRLYDKPLEAN